MQKLTPQARAQRQRRRVRVSRLQRIPRRSLSSITRDRLGSTLASKFRALESRAGWMKPRAVRRHRTAMNRPRYRISRCNRLRSWLTLVREADAPLRLAWRPQVTRLIHPESRKQCRDIGPGDERNLDRLRIPFRNLDSDSFALDLSYEFRVGPRSIRGSLKRVEGVLAGPDGFLHGERAGLI